MSCRRGAHPPALPAAAPASPAPLATLAPGAGRSPAAIGRGAGRSPAAIGRGAGRSPAAIARARPPPPWRTMPTRPPGPGWAGSARSAAVPPDVPESPDLGSPRSARRFDRGGQGEAVGLRPGTGNQIACGRGLGRSGREFALFIRAVDGHRARARREGPSLVHDHVNSRSSGPRPWRPMPPLRALWAASAPSTGDPQPFPGFARPADGPRPGSTGVRAARRCALARPCRRIRSSASRLGTRHGLGLLELPCP